MSSIAMNESGWNEFLGLDRQQQVSMLDCLSQQKLKSLSKAVNQARDELYDHGNGRPKYGNLRRVFKMDEMEKLFSIFTSTGVKACFALQFFYGLRIGEISSVSKCGNTLRIENIKMRRTEYIPIHGKTKRLVQWLSEFQERDTHYLRKKFRRSTKLTGLDNVYAESKDGRPLYQFSSHSLRKTAITVFTNNVDNELKVKNFARHKGRDVTMRYFDYDFRTWKKDLENAFDEYYQLIKTN